LPLANGLTSPKRVNLPVRVVTLGRSELLSGHLCNSDGIQAHGGIVGEKGNVVAAAQATAHDTLGRVTTTVTGVAVETATMAGDTLRDKAIEHSVDHAIAEIRDRTHDRRENAEEHTDPDASPEPPAP